MGLKIRYLLFRGFVFFALSFSLPDVSATPDIDSLKIIPLNKLEKGAQYQIRAKAELDKLTLPFYLHYVLFFISLWDCETDWYTVVFIY